MRDYIKCIWVAGTLAVVYGCSPGDGSSKKQQAVQQPPASSRTTPVVDSAIGPFAFSEVAKSSGIHFRHHSPLTEQRHVHLVMGSGIGWFDLERDGWPDLYCCQGASFAGIPQNDPPSNALFRNLDGQIFSEASLQAGLRETDYSMGIASADYDNDGFADLCVTGYETNTLLHNNGDGTFSTATLPRHSSPGRLSASCAWADIDADGNLDLYVTNYAILARETYPICEHTAAGTTIHIACHPSNLDRIPDLLYRNTGDGEFVDLSELSGIVKDEGRQGLGVVAADLDQDGDTDFYVGNDTTPNYLWENQGNSRYVDRGADSGTATNRHGAREASMGVAVGDVDGNGQLDLFVTNFYDETNTLYRNAGNLLFADVTDETGLGAPSRLRLAFGASFTDFDNDGWLDLFVANGHIHDRLDEIGRNGSFAQLSQIFYNDHGRRFQDVSDVCGPYFLEPRVARGTAIADYDRDGDSDMAVSHLNSDAVLLQNQTAECGRWLRVELIGIESNRDGIGATIQIDLGDRVLVRSIQAGGSYLSCDDRPVLIGLGSLDKVRELTVIWPGGRRESWRDLDANTLCLLRERDGRRSGEQ